MIQSTSHVLLLGIKETWNSHLHGHVASSRQGTLASDDPVFNGNPAIDLPPDTKQREE
jgi:hypothetical protein